MVCRESFYVEKDVALETSSYNKKQGYDRIMNEICRAAFEKNICIIGMTI